MDPEIWNKFSKSYLTYQHNQAVLTLTLLNMMRFQEANNILDAGCAGGHLHQYILQQRKQQCYLNAFDYSEQMIKISAARMNKFIQNPLQGNLEKITDQEIENAQIDNPLFKNNNYHLFQADIQDLSQINDNTYDIYYSSLVYHLIKDKDKALSEAYRILKPGGRFGINIPSNFEKNELMFIFFKIMKNLQLINDLPYSPSSLETIEGGIEFAKKQGFTNIYCWKQNMAFDYYEINMNYFPPTIIQLIQNQPKEKQELFFSSFQAAIDERKKNNQPFQLETICLIGTKPNQE